MKKTLLVVGTLAFSAISSFAGIATDNVSYNTADATNVAGLVLLGVATIWGIRKAITIANRG